MASVRGRYLRVLVLAGLSTLPTDREQYLCLWAPGSVNCREQGKQTKNSGSLNRDVIVTPRIIPGCNGAPRCAR